MRRFFLPFLLVLTLLFLALPAAADIAANGKIVVVIDPGHGGIDGGTDTGTKTEKEYNLSIACCIRDALLNDGHFEVYMTRSDNDTYLKFLPRAQVALEHNADLVLSVHCNSHTDPASNGLMAYVSLVPECNAKPLADRILDHVSAAVGIKRGRADTVADTGDSLGVYYWNSERMWDMPGEASLGMPSDYYSINTWCSKFGIPSIIVEHGYLTNEGDLALLDDLSTLQQMAWTEAGAIISYYTDHEHVWSDVKTDFPSNCVMNGSCSSRCGICGCRSGVNPLPAAPDEDETHYWRASASKAATCTEEGWIEYTCQVSFNLSDKGYPCDVHTKTVTLPPKGHSFVTAEDTPAGHGTDGRLVRYCEICGGESVEIRPGEPHEFEITETVPATCTEEGHAEKVCKICGKTETEILPLAEHSLNGDGVCTECGVRIVGGSEDASCEHNWEPLSVPPSCEEEGKEGRRCSLCGAEEYTAVPAPGHEYEIQMQVEPTCTEEGCIREKCTRCGELEQEILPPAGHDYILKEEDGKPVMLCSVCGAAESDDPDLSGEEADGTGKHRSLKENPVLIGVLAVIGLQVAAVIVWLIVRHAKFRAEEEARSRRALSYRDETDWQNAGQFAGQVAGQFAGQFAGQDAGQNDGQSAGQSAGQNAGSAAERSSANFRR